MFNIRAGELAPVMLACAYFFCLLACNYVLRPVRDEMGIARGADGLTWWMTGTLIATVCVNPIFSLLVARLSRRRFIPITYHFFAANLSLFYGMMFVLPHHAVWLQAAFFIWMSVFNLFAVSVFWGFMSDLFTNEQGKRLYALIGVGGTLGAIFGSQLTNQLVAWFGNVGMLLVAAVLLELACVFVFLLARRATAASTAALPSRLKAETFEKTSAWAGLKLVVQRPYLRILVLYMVLQTSCNTFMYFQQADILRAYTDDPNVRTAVLANINTWVNAVSLVMQIFFSGRLIASLGITTALLFLPSLAALGFAGLSVSSTLLMLAVMQVATRACEYATARPARETLYTVVSRTERYQSKSFIDTFVYRGGDAVASWANQGLKALGLGIKTTALASVPLALTWLVTAFLLGRRQEALANRAAQAATAAPEAQRT